MIRSSSADSASAQPLLVLDLVIAQAWALLTGLAAVTDLPVALHLFLALPTLFLIPGFLLCLVIYPGVGDLPPHSRIPLSIISSTCVAGILAYILAVSPILLTRFTLTGSLITLITALALLAGLRRRHLSQHGHAPAPGTILTNLQNGPRKLPDLNYPVVLLSAAVVFALLAGAFAVGVHPVNESFTEFLAHKPPGTPDKAGEILQVEVRNHESGDRVYEIESYLINNTSPTPNLDSIQIDKAFSLPAQVPVRQGEVAVRNLSLIGSDLTNGSLVLLLFEYPAPPDRVQGVDRLIASYRSLSIVLGPREGPSERTELPVGQ